MTKEQLNLNYEIKGGRIVSPGKFEGEPMFAPHFWELGLEGFADEDDGKVYKFKLDETDLTDAGTNPFCRELKEWLGRKRTLRMIENDQGFVHCF